MPTIQYSKLTDSVIKNNASIKTEADVIKFISDIYNHLDLNFHPDEPFSNYVGQDDKELYTKSQASKLDIILDKCIDLVGEDRFYELLFKLNNEIVWGGKGPGQEIVESNNKHYDDKKITNGIYIVDEGFLWCHPNKTSVENAERDNLEYTHYIPNGSKVKLTVIGDIIKIDIININKDNGNEDFILAKKNIPYYVTQHLISMFSDLELVKQVDENVTDSNLADDKFKDTDTKSEPLHLADLDIKDTEVDKKEIIINPLQKLPIQIKETFKSKKQSNYFRYMASKKGKEGKKWKNWTKEWSDDTDFSSLPDSVSESLNIIKSVISWFKNTFNGISLDWKQIAPGVKYSIKNGEIFISNNGNETSLGKITTFNGALDKELDIENGTIDGVLYKDADGTTYSFRTKFDVVDGKLFVNKVDYNNCSIDRDIYESYIDDEFVSIKQELRELSKKGIKNVSLNGFDEDIDYVKSLNNLKRIECGSYETIDESLQTKIQNKVEYLKYHHPEIFAKDGTIRDEAGWKYYSKKYDNEFTSPSNDFAKKYYDIFNNEGNGNDIKTTKIYSEKYKVDINTVRALLIDFFNKDTNEKRGLWDNIMVKRKRGEAPVKPKETNEKYDVKSKSFKDLPDNIIELVNAGKVTYRGTGMEIDSPVGTLIKVDGQEYLISDKQFDRLGGIKKIRFSAPYRTNESTIDRNYPDFITGEYEGEPNVISGEELYDLLESGLKTVKTPEDFVNYVAYGITDETSELSSEDQEKLINWFNKNKGNKIQESKSNDDIKFKNKKSTDKEEANIAIFYKEKEIGYMMPIKSKNVKVGDNYNIQFTFKGNKYIKNFLNKQKALDYLYSIINKTNESSDLANWPTEVSVSKQIVDINGEVLPEDTILEITFRNPSRVVLNDKYILSTSDFIWHFEQGHIEANSMEQTNEAYVKYSAFSGNWIAVNNKEERRVFNSQEEAENFSGVKYNEIVKESYYGDYKQIVTKVYTKANTGGYPQNDQDNLAYELRKLDFDKNITLTKLIKDPNFNKLSQDTQNDIKLAIGTGKSHNAAFVKAYVDALKNFGTGESDLDEKISYASVMQRELADNSYPTSYIGLNYQDRRSLEKDFGRSYEMFKKLTPEEKTFVQLATKPRYENFVKRTLTDHNFETVIKKELEWTFKNNENSDEIHFIGTSWRQEALKPLFDYIVSIITGDDHNPKWETFKVLELKMLDTKHSDVVSSSFSTTYYYSAKVEFEGKVFEIPSFIMSSDYYSGGWN